MRRSADELVAEDDAWPLLQSAFDKAGVTVEVVPVEMAAGRHELEHLQVTTHSALGAIAYRTGGVLVDHGWLRILGAGSARCPWAISGLTTSLGWGRDYAPPGAVAVGCHHIITSPLHHFTTSSSRAQLVARPRAP